MMRRFSSFICNITNNLKFSDNSEICIFFIKNVEFVTKFWPNAYQNVLGAFFGREK